jgi:hypothetical protein
MRMLQAELDANTSRRELNEWGEAAPERIKLLPEDWQDTLRMRFRELMLDLQQRELRYDANGVVVWEEDGERPATPADNDGGLDIPRAHGPRPRGRAEGDRTADRHQHGGREVLPGHAGRVRRIRDQPPTRASA